MVNVAGVNWCSEPKSGDSMVRGQTVRRESGLTPRDSPELCTEETLNATMRRAGRSSHTEADADDCAKPLFGASAHPSPGDRPPPPLAARGEGRVRGVVAVLQCFVAINRDANPLTNHSLPRFRGAACNTNSSIFHRNARE